MADSESKKPWGSADLAEAAGVSDSLVRKYCAKGEIPGAYKIGKTWLIPRETGQQWLDNRRRRWEKY
jgi:excisionase family DNA binding protein